MEADSGGERITRYARSGAQWDSLDMDTQEALIHQVYTSITDFIILRKRSTY